MENVPCSLQLSSPYVIISYFVLRVPDTLSSRAFILIYTMFSNKSQLQPLPNLPRTHAYINSVVIVCDRAAQRW